VFFIKIVNKKKLFKINGYITTNMFTSDDNMNTLKILYIWMKKKTFKNGPFLNNSFIWATKLYPILEDKFDDELWKISS
jgi:hypothetical protein